MNKTALTAEMDSGPVILALDTSTASLSAALLRGGEVAGELQSLAERNHSVQVVPKVQELLAAAGIRGEAINGIAVGRGPGSYTGMRIAVSVAKTLAWVWNKPLIGVSSLEALAYGAHHRLAGGNLPGTAWFVPLMDARRGQVYSALFESGGTQGWRRQTSDGIRLMHDWVDELYRGMLALEPQERPKRIWLVGDPALHQAEAERLRDLCAVLPAASVGGAVDVRIESFTMEGRWIGELGAMRLAAGQQDDVHSFVPNYTQLTEAEVNLLAKTRGE